MQMLVLLMVMSVMACRASGPLVDQVHSAPVSLMAMIGVYLLPMALSWWAHRRCLQRLVHRPHLGHRWLKRLYRINSLHRASILTLHLLGLFVFNLPGFLDRAIGPYTLLNNALLLLLPFGSMSFNWWMHYPIDRHLREQSLLRQLDEGQVVFSFHSRWDYVIEQLRHQVLLILVPLGVLMIWMATVQWSARQSRWMAEYQQWVSLAGGLCVFVFAPLLLRYIWRTVRMPDGPLRDRLLALCRAHKVRIAELLLWQTHGGLINGAVMGLIAPARFILLTDGLIEQLDDEKIEAVMAHELGHVRRHHMPWMAVSAMGIIGLCSAGVDAIYRWAVVNQWISAGQPYWTHISLGIVAAGWFVAFGYVSRRFERQADTFAVQHLSSGEPSGLITHQAAEAMAGALRGVCQLNHMPTSRKSWRHGSIDWRIDYLKTLPGQPANKLKIDRQVRAIRWLSLLMLLATIGLAELDLAGL